MKPHILIIGLAALLTAGCVSNGIAPMGYHTYMIQRGGWPHMNGFAVEAKCYRDANQFCTNQGLIMVPITTATIDGEAFAHNASCKLVFRAVADTNDPAYKAYQEGNFTATYPVQPQEQIDSRRQAILQQLQAAQRQQQQDNQKALLQSRAESDRIMSNMSQGLNNNTPVLQAHPLLPGMQPDQSLPAAWEMPRTSDMQTGKTKTGPDGRLWHERRTPSGYCYWQVDQ